jgi:mycothiol synthase
MPNLPPGFTWRAPGLGDIESVVALVRECEEADEGDAETTLDDQRGDWERPRFDLEKDAWLVVAADGRPAGYADLWDRVPRERFVADGHVRPEFGGHGVGTWLVRTAEARGREKAAPEGAMLSHTIFHGDEAAHRLLIAEGYTVAQHYWRMVMQMIHPPQEPDTPEGIRVRTFEPGADDRRVWDLVQEAFSDNERHAPSPFEEWALFMLERESFDPSLFYVAESDAGEVAGVALCPSYDGWPGCANWR